jgi:IS30 family transposase
MRIEREYQRPVEAIFPQETNVSVVTQPELNAAARRLKERPRKNLNYETPVDRFHYFVASTG